MADDDRIRGVLGEQLLGELQAIRELVTDVPAIKATVDQHTLELRDLKGRLIVVEDVVRGHSTILKEHSADIRELKTDIRELKTDVKEMKADLKEVRQIVGGQQEAITELKAAGR
jgi:chromosome segregation ATPase